MCLLSEPGGNLEVERAVITSDRNAPVVRKIIVSLEYKVLAKVIVRRERVDGFQGLPVFVLPVAVVTAEQLEMVEDGRTKLNVPCITVVGTVDVGGVLAFGGDVFSPRTPFPVIIHIPNAPAFPIHALQIRAVPFIVLVCVFAVPSEATDGQSLDGGNPHTADDILKIVLVRMVDSLSVEHTDLVVQPGMPVAGREKVALYLGTDIASGTFMTVDTVVNGSQLQSGLGVVSYADIQGTQRILETDGAFELSHLDAEEIIFLPFYERIHYAWTVVVRWHSVDLHLQTVVEVVETISRHAQPDKAEVEPAIPVARLSVSGVDAILAYDVTTEFDAGVESFP